jgi:hypothetical protein
MDLAAWLKRHPIFAAVGAVVVFFIWELPEWLGNVWPAFVKDKTIPEWLASHRWPGMTASAHTVATVVMFSVLLILVLVALLPSRGKQSLQDLTAQPNISVEVEPGTANVNGRVMPSANIFLKNTGGRFWLVTYENLLRVSLGFEGIGSMTFLAKYREEMAVVVTVLRHWKRRHLRQENTGW